eukprot:GHVQ01029915.1.p1 GENE.GHVQ01029915.1~~GHVQ01029915.1.p1  ORF type:complete len:160 (-),score=24.29 GHVQ01029915.1:252-731(-)
MYFHEMSDIVSTKDSKDKSMVEIQGTLEGHFSFLVQLAGATTRFCGSPEAAAEEKQLLDKDKWLVKAELPSFTGTVEKDLEEWIDKAARTIVQHNLGLSLFCRLWAAVSKPRVADLIMSVTCDDYEELVSLVAVTLFPSSSYVVSLEEEICKGCRTESS